MRTTAQMRESGACAQNGIATSKVHCPSSSSNDFSARLYSYVTCVTAQSGESWGVGEIAPGRGALPFGAGFVLAQVAFPTLAGGYTEDGVVLLVLCVLDFLYSFRDDR